MGHGNSRYFTTAEVNKDMLDDISWWYSFKLIRPTGGGHTSDSNMERDSSYLQMPSSCCLTGAGCRRSGLGGRARASPRHLHNGASQRHAVRLYRIPPRLYPADMIVGPITFEAIWLFVGS